MPIIITIFMLATISGLSVIVFAIIEDIIKWSKNVQNKLDK